MASFARRTLPALLIVLVLGLMPASTAQARPLLNKNSANVYETIGLHGFLHHLWTGLLSLVGNDGSQIDPNGKR